jgi:hypothetical protein
MARGIPFVQRYVLAPAHRDGTRTAAGIKAIDFQISIRATKVDPIFKTTIGRF